ncbi:hypothetical protein PBS_34010 [Paraburkholderia sp. 2C]
MLLRGGSPTTDEARNVLTHVVFRKSTQQTLASAEAVLSILPHVRAQVRRGQRGAGGGAAMHRVPVFERFGRVMAGLSISFPSMRCGADTKAHYVALLKESGRAISAQLGYRDSLRTPD